MDKVDLIIKQYPDVWKTRAAFFSWLKGTIRRAWNNSPQKIKLIQRRRRQIANPNPKGHKATVWGDVCEICGKEFILKDMHIDHVSGETARLTELSHIQSCVEKLLVVVDEDLRHICKGCHEIHSLSQKLGVPFQEAALEKKAIAFGKRSVAEQNKILQELVDCGKITSIPRNAKSRREAYLEYLKKEEQ